MRNCARKQFPCPLGTLNKFSFRDDNTETLSLFTVGCIQAGETRRTAIFYDLNPRWPERIIARDINPEEERRAPDEELAAAVGAELSIKRAAPEETVQP